MDSSHFAYIPYEGPLFEALHSNIKEIYRIAIKHYGVDRVCLNREKDAHLCLEDATNTPGLVLLVYYPEVTITNSAGRTHPIKELYVKVALSEVGTLDSKFTIHRTCLSEDEIRSKYIHSHVLPKSYYHIDGTNYHGCETVCLGSGELESTLSLLYDNFDRDYFELFFHQLDTFVAWESLEGGPFVFMSSMYSDSYTTISRNIPIEKHEQSITIADARKTGLFPIYAGIIKEAIKNPNLELGVIYDDLGNTPRIVINNTFLELQSILSHTRLFRQIAQRKINNEHLPTGVSYLVTILSSDLTKSLTPTELHQNSIPFINQEVPVLYFKGTAKCMKIERSVINDTDNKIYSIRRQDVLNIKYIMEKYINKQICK